MAFETESVDAFRAQQMGIFATMRLVTSTATLFEGRLVQVSLIALLSLIAMTG